MARSLFGFALGVVVTTLVAVSVLSLNASGTRWLIERACAWSDGAVSAVGIDGTLARGLRIDALQLRFGATAVDVHALEIEPAWVASFFRNAVIVDRVAAASLRVTSGAASEPAPLMLAVPVSPIPFELRSVDIERIEFDAMAADVVPRVHGRVAFDGEAYLLSDVTVRSDAYGVTGNFAVLPAADVPVSAALSWAVVEPAASGRIEVSGTLRELVIAATTADPVAASARGRVYLLGEIDPRFDIEATLAEWVSDPVRITDATVHLTGTYDRFSVNASAQVHSPDLPPSRLTLIADGSLDALDVSRLEIVSDQGGAVGAGRIARLPEPLLELTLDLKDLDPALAAPALSGALSGHVQLALRGDDVSLDVASLSGRLNGAPFDAAGHVARSDGIWTAHDVQLRSGPNRATMALNWNGTNLVGDAKLDMPDLSTLVPELHGDVTGRVSVTGEPRAPNVDVDVVSRALQFREWSSANTRVAAAVKGATTGAARVTLDRLTRNEVQIERVDVDARGSLDSISARVGWSLGEQRGAMQLSAKKDRERWAVTIADGALITLPGELLRLDRPLSATIVGTTLAVSTHCWERAAGGGRVCVERADVGADRMRLAGSIDAVPVTAAAKSLVTGTELAGTVSGGWDVASEAGHWRGEAALHTDGLAIVQGEESGEGQTVELPRVEAEFDVADEHIKARVRADNASARVLTAELNIHGFDANAALDGHATLAVADLAFIATFTRRIGEISGALNGQFDIGGSLAAPTVAGALTIDGARLMLTEPRVELTELDLVLRADDLDHWTLRGSAASDDGGVQIDGELVEPFADTRRFHARIVATNLPARIPDVAVRVGGSVDFDWRPGLYAVKGRVEIPRATITLSELPAGAVAVSDDVIVVDREEQRGQGTRLSADLEIVLKDDVKFSAFGLTTRLVGTLRLRQSVDGAIQLNGTLTLVDGTFVAFGQTLAIDSGRLIYTGPPDNPYVDATASRTIQELGRTVRVGARIQGPARELETTLTSDPPMSDAETLAYLVLGRPLSSATAQEGNNVMGAAIALGLKGASPVIKEVTDALGLEELTATGGSTEDLTVVAGKRFSSRVFVRYSYQTFTRMSAILVELMLSRRLALEATVSEIPAMDVIYKVGDDN